MNRWVIILFCIVLAIAVFISTAIGYFVGYSDIEKAYTQAVYIYCADEGREACEDNCCTIKRFVRQELEDINYT